MNRIFIVLIITFTLISCGAESEKVKINMQFTEAAGAGSAWRDGGLVIFGKNNEGKLFSYVLNPNEASFSHEIPVGTWNINVIAWDGDAGAHHMKGVSRCGKQTIFLDSDKTLEIEISKANCANTLATGEAFYGNRFSDSEFETLPVYMCDATSLNPDDLANCTAQGGTNSYKIVIPSYKNFEVEDDTGVNHPALISGCYAGASNGVNLPYAVHKSTGIKIIKVKVYPGSIDCNPSTNNPIEIIVGSGHGYVESLSTPLLNLFF